MPKQNVPLLAYNRGIVSPKGLARVDVERTRLSAATMRNWLPKSLGPMTIRPGTKYLGSTKNDTGAEFIEFVAAADETALVELTASKMRVWLDDALLTRPTIATTLTDFNADTGAWTSASSGGGVVGFGDTGLVLDAANVGGLAKVVRRVTISDTGDLNTEHGLAINVGRGPVTFRCGTDTGDDSFITETTLKTGRHSLAFTPTVAEFHLVFQSNVDIDRIVTSIAIEAAGAMEVTAPWTRANLDDVRYDQSADVVFVACIDVKQRRIERRGTGRSWSVVEYAPDNGPFIPGRTSAVRLKVGATFGNTTLTSDLPFFLSSHVGALFRGFHTGQNGVFNLARENIFTDSWSVTGVGSTTERRSTIVTTGFGVGNLRVQRSFDGPDEGFRTVATITTNTTTNVDDTDNNLTVWYRLAIPTGDYTSGTIIATLTYTGGGKTGVCRVTSFTSKTVVNVEILERFSSTDWTTDWNEGQWSTRSGFPTSVQLYEGRLWWAGGAQVFGSVSDDYENFDDATEGDSAPLSRSLGKGPVDRVTFMIAALRLLLGTSSAVLALRSTGFDEPLTQTNANAKPAETKGAANLRGLLVDTRVVFVHRSGERLFSLGFDVNVGDYTPTDFSKLAPDLLSAGIVSIAVQRFPDTRIHCVLDDGTVALLTYDEAEEILCWSMWDTDGLVERAMVLPGEDEDAIYYVIKRTINSVTRRFVERWASESECIGGTQTWLADCAIAVTGPVTTIPAAHLVGEAAILWGDSVSQSPVSDTGVQTTFMVGAGGTFTASSVTSGVVGLPYNGDHVSTKLAYAAALGTALTQQKRLDHVGFILYKTHNNGLYFGSDTGHLNPLPREHEGVAVTTNQLFETYDSPSFPFPGKFDTDARMHLRCYAPHPVTVMASVPSISTHDKI